MAKIIPGVSGALLAISLGIYEKILNIIAHPLRIKISDLKFLILLLFGAGGGILFFCLGVQWCLDKWQFATMMLFIGFIFGGINDITFEMKNNYCLKNWIFLSISFILLIYLTSLSGNSGDSNHYFLMGFIESLTTIIPGISGTAIFMALGWYESVLKTIHGILTFTLPIKISIYYISGFIICTILLAKILSFLFVKYKAEMYFCIMGFMSASICTMVLNLMKLNFSICELITGIFLFFTGIIFTIKINSIFSKY